MPGWFIYSKPVSSRNFHLHPHPANAERMVVSQKPDTDPPEIILHHEEIDGQASTSETETDDDDESMIEDSRKR